jgi:glycerol kinase
MDVSTRLILQRFWQGEESAVKFALGMKKIFMACIGIDCYGRIIEGQQMIVVALDQGTTSSRAIVFDRKGKIAAIGQREFAQSYPESGWVEHDPEEIWLSQLRALEEAIGRLRSPGGLRAENVVVGLTNQRETIVLWERRSGKPAYPAIVWQDRRTSDATRAILESGDGAWITNRTGLQIDPYFSATKLRWLLDHVPDARARAADGELAAGTIDSWLLWKLTDGEIHATDASNASRTMLMDLRSRAWDAELLDYFGIPAPVLGEIRDSAGDFGECRTGPLRGHRITGVVGDQQAALYGQGCKEMGLAKNTYGTGSFLLMNTGSAPVVSHNRLLTTVAWGEGGHCAYALEGSVFVSGAVVQLLRDGLGLFRVAPMVEALAASVPDNGGVTFVPAFTGLGAPHWKPDARGMICGLTRATTDAHIARAALEAIALQSRDVLLAMEKDSGIDLRELRVDGGASGNNLLMQIQADVLQRPVARAALTEVTAYGAALMAAKGSGDPTAEGALAAIEIERRFEPLMSEEDARTLIAQWEEALALVKS